jgi:protein SCO1/2
VAMLRGPLSLRTQALIVVLVFLCVGGVAAGITLATTGGSTSKSASTAAASANPTIQEANSVVTRPPVSWRAGQQLAPNFVLRDLSGRPISPSAYRGRQVLITFIDPQCRDVCPLEAQVLDQAIERMPASQRPAIIAVSVNPYGNSRSTLVRDEHKWHVLSNWHWAIGSYAQLAAVWKNYKIAVQFTRKQVDGHTDISVSHTVGTYVLDSTGHERALFIWPFYPQDVERILRQLP